jgi:hypothetical protein
MVTGTNNDHNMAEGNNGSGGMDHVLAADVDAVAVDVVQATAGDEPPDLLEIVRERICRKLDEILKENEEFIRSCPTNQSSAPVLQALTEMNDRLRVQRAAANLI